MSPRRFLITVVGFWVAFVVFTWLSLTGAGSGRPFGIIAAIGFFLLGCGGLIAYPKFRRGSDAD